MEIRFAKPEDVAGILKLLKQVGKVHHLGRPDLFRENAQKYGASQVLAMLEGTKTPIFVAEEDGQVLGYGFCIIKTHREDPVMKDYTELYIDDLCVEESSRGKHVGKAIYEAILRYAKMRKCYNVTLNVWACNEAALGFYRALGMQTQKIGMETILEETEC